MVQVRDGDTYTTEYDYNFDVASSPLSVTRYTSASGSSTPRIKKTTYEDKVSNWILDLPKTISLNGREEASLTYNELGQLTSYKRYGQEDYLTYGYNTDGTVSSITDALGRITRASNWKRGKPQAVTRADGSVTRQTLDDNGWVLNSTDAMKRVTRYTRDTMGRLTKYDPHGSWNPTYIDYDFNGGGAVQTIAKGQAKTTVTYDSMFRPILERSQALDTGWSSYTNTKYDAAGQVKFKSQPSTNAYETKGVETTYDGLGRVYDITENVAPYAKTRHRYYSSHRHRVYDPSNAFTQYYSYGYGGPGNTDYRAIYKYGNGAYQQYTYIYKDVFGETSRVKQWGGIGGISVNKTQYFYYDSQRRLCRHYVPEHGASRYQYDAAGQMTAYAKGLGNSGCGAVPSSASKVTLAYDKLGRVTTKNYGDPKTPDVHLTYDKNGNVKTNKRGGMDWAYNYNDIDALTHETLAVDGRSFTSVYGYDGSGSLKQRQYPSGNTVSFNPDGLGRARGAKYSSTAYASGISYHPSGAMSALRYGNGQTFTQTLNARLLPQRLLSTKGSVKALDLGYSYDALGKVTSILDGAVPGNNRSFTYDPLGQLKTASGPWGSGSFTYDSLGNLRSKTLGARKVSLSYDSKNRLSQSVDTGDTGTRAVGYDARGNVTALGNLSFIYDMADQPRHVSGTANGVGSANGTYHYDGNFKRVKSVVNGVTIYNVYDASGALIHVYNKSKNEKTDYISAGGMSVARVTNNVPTYLHNDHLGSAVSGTKASGAVDWTEQYSPFGITLKNAAANNNQAGFTGHIKDSATGLNYMQARYYDPVIGRFLSIDPVTFMDTGKPEYFNRYSYTANDPINFTDPDGRTTCPGSPECSASNNSIRQETVTANNTDGSVSHTRQQNEYNRVSDKQTVTPTASIKRLPQDTAGGAAAPISSDMTSNLLDVSEAVDGQTVNVTSGFRSQASQDAIRAAGNPRAARRSSHTYNDAADINVDGMSDGDLADAAADTGNFARSNTYSRGGDVHVDQNNTTRNQGRVCDYGPC